MSRQKRPFYIIGHNPNSIEEAREFLNKGANGLEPDIVHAKGQFYVSHETRQSYEDVLKLEEYLAHLKDLITTQKYDLALIIWDLKESDFDPNDFIAVVKQNFSGGVCDGVAMLMTHSDDHDFVSRYNGAFANVGVGVDESNVPAPMLERLYKKSGQKNFSYADGITTFLNKPGVFKMIREAQRHRDQQEPGSFGLIYTWVLSREAAMIRYLNTCIDGIMVDIHSVEKLKTLISQAPFKDVYELTHNGYSPFAAPAIPKYLLTIKTKDKFLAGTDATFVFTLKGKSGLSLTSLPFNSNEEGALERGSITHVTLEGEDLGEIKSLTVEPITAGLTAGWLPERITVHSALLKGNCIFDFNRSDAEEWITMKRGPVTKFPT